MESNDEFDDGFDSVEKFSRRLQEALSVSDRDGKVLLCCAWTDDENRRKFEMFPEFTGSDTTEGTNSEKRPLQTHCRSFRRHTSESCQS